jgi:hypothetical protein
MARKLRYPGALYHVMSRGDRREPIFRDDGPKGDLANVRLAARLREQTTMTVARVAERLQMGTAGCVNNLLYRWRKGLL